MVQGIDRISQNENEIESIYRKNILGAESTFQMTPFSIIYILPRPTGDWVSVSENRSQGVVSSCRESHPSIDQFLSAVLGSQYIVGHDDFVASRVSDHKSPFAVCEDRCCVLRRKGDSGTVRVAADNEDFFLFRSSLYRSQLTYLCVGRVTPWGLLSSLRS